MQRFSPSRMLALAALAACVSLHASWASPPDPERDELCFLNFDPALADSGVPVLGAYAVDKGACQGMAGIMAAFREGARFAPELPAPASAEEAQALLKQVMRQHRTGVVPGSAAARVVIPGFGGLREFCERHRTLFLRESVLYNAEIAVIEIAPLLPEFEYRKRSLIGDGWGLRRLDGQISRLRDELDRGRSPLLLYYSHVVMVFAMVEQWDAAWNLAGVELQIIDPNQRELGRITVPYANGLPAADRSLMLWDVTPNR